MFRIRIQIDANLNSNKVTMLFEFKKNSFKYSSIRLCLQKVYFIDSSY